MKRLDLKTIFQPLHKFYQDSNSTTKYFATKKKITFPIPAIECFFKVIREYLKGFFGRNLYSLNFIFERIFDKKLLLVTTILNF